MHYITNLEMTMCHNSSIGRIIIITRVINVFLCLLHLWPFLRDNLMQSRGTYHSLHIIHHTSHIISRPLKCEWVLGLWWMTASLIHFWHLLRLVFCVLILETYLCLLKETLFKRNLSIYLIFKWVIELNVPWSKYYLNTQWNYRWSIGIF